MQLGNREKIVFGSITLILTIAALHFFIFSPKAQQLSQAKKSYNQMLRQYNQVGSVPSPVELKKYEEQTKQYDDQFVKLVRGLKLAIAQYNVQKDPESVEKRRQDFINLIDQLLTARNEKEAPKLSFLGDKGWDLPTSLPENIEKRRINLWDLVSKLDAIHSILDVIVNETVKQTKEEERRQLLLQLGYDQQKVISLARYGDYVPLIKGLVHAQLIMEKKPEEYRLTKEKLYQLLRIEFPDDLLVYINKQLYALTDLLSMARENKIDDITMVRVLPKSEVFKEPQQEEAPQQQPGAAAATPAPAAPARPVSASPDMWAGGAWAGAAAGEAGITGPAARAAPTPPPRKLVCVIMPIQLRFSGSNLDVMKFLYEITHSMRTYAIDDLAIQSLNGSNVDVFVTVNVVVYVDGVSFEVQPAG
jgi:hypothetical protein